MTAVLQPLGLLLFALGCGGPEPVATPTSPTAGAVESAAMPEEPIIASEADRVAVADGNRRFAVDLYKQLATKPGSLVIAPGSVSEALAMTFAGGRGETAAEMAKALHFTLPPDRLHAAFGATRQQLTAAGKAGPFELSVADALFGLQRFEPKPEFQALTKRFYAAGLRQLPADLAAATREVNAWVAEQTRDKIKELLKPDDIKESTRLILGNAVYFRGEWAMPFDPSQTRQETFAVATSQSADVPMMSLSGANLRHQSDPAFDLLELPYAGDRLAMLVLLPKERNGLAAVEAGLTADRLRDAVGGLRPAACNVWLPKYTVKSREVLNAPLQSLGMRLAFRDGEADFSGVSDAMSLHVQQVIHGGLIEVDERGTTAAGATLVELGKSEGPPPVTFRTDHLFLFLIHDRPTGAVLFLGRYAGPA